jgi:Right handed beta helix region
VRLSYRLIFLVLASSTAALYPAIPQSQDGDRNVRVLQVGPDKALSVPSKAAAIAKDGDVIEIDAAAYTADAAVWKASNLTIRGVGGRPYLKAGGASAQGKAIWVIQGRNTTVENIEISGAKVPDGNGAGIRHEGAGLIIRNCYIHDNEMGLLTGNQQDNEVLIEGSEFSGSYGDYNHNIYIGNIRKFTLKFSYIHHATHGHNVKTRARENYILYNRIMDEATGAASYAIDIPNGGRSYIIGNVIQKGRKSENPSVIDYAAEGATNPLQEFYMVNNTVVSDHPGGFFLQVRGVPSDVQIVNNIFLGRDTMLTRTGTMRNNLVSIQPLFQSRETFDYRLRGTSPAIDKGTDPGMASGFDLAPQFEYIHPLRGEVRSTAGPIDIGAFEYVKK